MATAQTPFCKKQFAPRERTVDGKIAKLE